MRRPSTRTSRGWWSRSLARTGCASPCCSTSTTRERSRCPAAPRRGRRRSTRPRSWHPSAVVGTSAPRARSSGAARSRSATPTDDREGQPTRSAALPAGESEVDAALAPLRGAIRQVPPAYAAVKVGGRTAYSRARGGETLELAAREVQVHRLEMTDWHPPDARLLIVCSSGTYVRSIARDLGRALGSAAHLGSLRRLAIGAFDVSDAIGIEALRAAGRDAALARLRVMDDSVLALPRRYLDESARRLVGAGGPT